jgi:uncharacterized protein YjbI with pentapeptide repeats
MGGARAGSESIQVRTDPGKIMAKRTNRIAWRLAAILAALVLGGLGLLAVQLRPYWVAKYHGNATDLHNALLIYAPLREADLVMAILSGADLGNANLVGADLSGAVLNGANFRGADLRGACLSGANLSWKMVWRRDGPDGMVGEHAGSDGADLSNADLRGANLSDVDLSCARLTGADLSSADLRGTDLSDVGLSCVRLTGARYDIRTLWPAGFDPFKHGATLVK